MRKLLTACLFVVTTIATVSFIASTVVGPRTAAAKKPGSELVTATSPKVIGSAVEAASILTSKTTGPKSVLVLTLRSATQTTRCSNATMDAVVFTDKRSATPYSGSVADYFYENSYRQTSLSGRVVGPYTVDMTPPCTMPNMQRWADAADAAATAAGVNVSSYNSTVYVLPPESTASCSPWGGEWNKNRVWMRDDQCDAKHILSHELAKSVYGARLAHTPGAFFGDASTTMGGVFLPADLVTHRPADPSTFDIENTMGYFNAPVKIDAGWLPAKNIQTVTVGGNYKVAFLEAPSTEVQVVKIGTMFLSYRRAVGYDSDLRSQYLNNTSVHTGRNGGDTTLLANLGDGESFRDGYVTVTQTAHDATYAYLTVSFSGGTKVAGRAQAPQAKVRQLAAIEGDVGGWCLLPNGRVLIYQVGDSTFAYDIITKHRTLLGTDMHPESVSPRGDRFALSRSSDDQKGLWTMPIDPKTGTATGPAQRVSLREASGLRFSPDGKMVVYTAGPRPDSTWDVAVVAVTGGAERVVANYPDRVNSGWSADGKWLYVEVSGPNRMRNRISIERTPAAGGRSEPLFPAFSWDYQNVVGISPDGRVAFYQDNPRWFYYLTASGKAGEIAVALPTFDDGWGYDFSLNSMRYTTIGQVWNPGGKWTSTIYEVDMSPILKSLEKP